MAFACRSAAVALTAILIAGLHVDVHAQQAPGPATGQQPGAPGKAAPAASGAPAPQPTLERTDNNFRLLDTNQNGVIELDQDFGTDDPRLEQFGEELRRMDVDGDGVITRDEFFGKAQAGGSWRLYVAAVAALLAFAGLCVTVDAVLDKDRRSYLLPGLLAAVAGGAVTWFLAREPIQQLSLILTLALVVTVLTLIVAVILGKPVEEEPIEPFVPAGQQQKVYVIGSGGKGTASQPRRSPASRPSRPARPPRRPRRPPPSR